MVAVAQLLLRKRDLKHRPRNHFVNNSAHSPTAFKYCWEEHSTMVKDYKKMCNKS